MLLILWWKGGNKVCRYSLGLLLAEYMILLIYLTTLIRPAGIHELKLIPFWSYKAIMNGTTVLIQEHIMNVAVFIPIGFLASIIFNGLKWWMIVLIGTVLSIMIELMQYFLSRGFCETDDVIHNTLGCLIGVVLLKGIIMSHRYHGNHRILYKAR